MNVIFGYLQASHYQIIETINYFIENKALYKTNIDSGFRYSNKQEQHIIDNLIIFLIISIGMRDLNMMLDSSYSNSFGQ